MIAALIALQLATAPAPQPQPPPPLSLAELPPQPLEAGRCALFLWDRASGKRIAMLTAAPIAAMRVLVDGRITDLPQDNASGTSVLGFAPSARYRSASRSYEVALTLLPTSAGGAVVRDGSLTVTETDGSALVIPVAGIAGCP